MVDRRESRGQRGTGWERAWTAEIDRRLEEVRAGEVELRDADEVHAELRAHLAQLRSR